VNASSVLSEVVAWIEPIGGGWRYILSSKFRARTHEGWRHEHVGYVVWDVFWGLAGIAVSLVIGYFVIIALTK
jgi:hypothetical protein